MLIPIGFMIVYEQSQTEIGLLSKWNLDLGHRIIYIYFFIKCKLVFEKLKSVRTQSPICMNLTISRRTDRKTKS